VGRAFILGIQIAQLSRRPAYHAQTLYTGAPEYRRNFYFFQERLAGMAALSQS
jgi:hypothetical protein